MLGYKTGRYGIQVGARVLRGRALRRVLGYRALSGTNNRLVQSLTDSAHSEVKDLSTQTVISGAASTENTDTLHIGAFSENAVGAVGSVGSAEATYISVDSSMSSLNPTDEELLGVPNFYSRQLDQLLMSHGIYPTKRGTGDIQEDQDRFEAKFLEILALLGKLTPEGPAVEPPFDVVRKQLIGPRDSTNLPEKPAQWTKQSLLHYIEQLSMSTRYSSYKYSQYHVMAIMLDLLRINNVETRRSHSIEAYNAAIFAMAREKNFRACRQLYSWVLHGQHRPDIATFNLLIRVSVQVKSMTKRMSFISNLLKRMEKESLMVNHQTWNVVLAAIDSYQYQSYLLAAMRKRQIRVSSRTSAIFMGHIIDKFGPAIAVNLFKGQKYFKLDHFSALQILEGLLKQKNGAAVKQAWEYFLSCHKRRQVRANTDSLNLFLRFCGVQGRLDWCLGAAGAFRRRWNAELDKNSYYYLLVAINYAPYHPLKMKTAAWIYNMGKNYGGWCTFDNYNLRYITARLKREAERQGEELQLGSPELADPTRFTAWLNIQDLFGWMDVPELEYAEGSKKLQELENLMGKRDKSEISKKNDGEVDIVKIDDSVKTEDAVELDETVEIDDSVEVEDDKQFEIVHRREIIKEGLFKVLEKRGAR